MANIDVIRRLEKIETKLGDVRESGTDFLIRHLREYGMEKVGRALTQTGREKPFWWWMVLFSKMSEEKPFDRYRGLVPDELIESAYQHRLSLG